MQKEEKVILCELGREFSRITKEAVRISKRKRAIRDRVEPLLPEVIRLLNAELKTLKLGFGFGECPLAGYLADSPLLVSLYPRPLGVGPGHTDALTALVNDTKTLRRFRRMFPFRFTVTANNYGLTRHQAAVVARAVTRAQRRLRASRTKHPA